MYGSNEYGTGYYGQGPTEGTTFILLIVSATAVSTGVVSLKLLINYTVSATVTTSASITRQIGRTLSTATVTTTGFLTSIIVKALNIRRTTTRLLTLANITRGLNGLRKTVELNLVKTTKYTTTED
jgi:hypothetical protein